MRHLLVLLALMLTAATAQAQTSNDLQFIYDPGELPPTDSELKVAVGDEAPDFCLPAISGQEVCLSDYEGEHNVVISFVPAAFTPVCSQQWPGYNIAKPLFAEQDAMLLGITTDNAPSLAAWVSQMSPDGVWFPVLSDFWPHGEATKQFGLLRGDGTTERALVVIDKAGVIRHINVSNINERPELGQLMTNLSNINDAKGEN
jgi:peroxiredoxin